VPARLSAAGHDMSTMRQTQPAPAAASRHAGHDMSTMGQTQDQIGRLKNLQLQLGTLQTQISTGKKSQTLKGLGNDVIITKRARADFQKLDSYMLNIDRANTRIAQMQGGLSTIKTQANNVLDSIVNQTQKGDIELDSIRRLADNAYDFIVDTLNLKDGTAFIFAGSDTASQPIIDSGAIDAYYADLNAQWSAGTLPITPPNTTISQEYISRYRNIPEVTLGLSGTLTDSKQVYVRADDTVEINYTLKANNQAMKDILTAVSAMRNISNLDVAPGAAEQEKQNYFFEVFNDVANLISSAVDKLDVEGFKLSTAQAQLNDVRKEHVIEKNTLLNTISSIEDIDLNEAAVKIQSLGVQLEASYQVTALVSKLSLANYL
jgi:flagellar hook-associated protein 3 FlgL